MTQIELAKLSGAELLRLIVRNMDATRESINDKYDAPQLVKLYTMHLLSEWDFYPDQWTDRQRKEALEGYPPHWNNDEEPVYAGGPGYPHKRVK